MHLLHIDWQAILKPVIPSSFYKSFSHRDGAYMRITCIISSSSISDGLLQTYAMKKVSRSVVLGRLHFPIDNDTVDDEDDVYICRLIEHC